MPRAKESEVLLLPPSNVCFLRDALGITLPELARILGVAPLTVRRWEHGTPPSGLASEVLRGIAHAIELGVDPSQILTHLNTGVGAFVARALTRKRP